MLVQLLGRLWSRRLSRERGPPCAVHSPGGVVGCGAPLRDSLLEKEHGAAVLSAPLEPATDLAFARRGLALAGGQP